jgi:hypothetical protein
MAACCAAAAFSAAACTTVALLSCAAALEDELIFGCVCPQVNLAERQSVFKKSKKMIGNHDDAAMLQTHSHNGGPFKTAR